MADPSTKRIAIVGGGLVGCLNACYLARRGFQVDLYEMRPDPRLQEHCGGRSINLTLSCRGHEALKGVGLDGRVGDKGLPLYARLVHHPSGRTARIPYGKGEQSIVSVERWQISEVLLNAAEKYSNVRIHFDHKLMKSNIETGDLVFQHDGEEVMLTVDLIVGCDGALSAVRQQMARCPKLRLNFQQDYICHGYMELLIPPTHDGQYALDPEHLHIWPRNDFMMIALPNLDRSCTVSLFMPFRTFDAITTEDQLIKFFNTNFKDSVPLFNEAYLKKAFFANKAHPLMTVKCHPYHVGDKAVIMGDAAHAMVPFYGQGMNCGFEDCVILDELLEKYNNDFSKALPAFTEMRSVDAAAICDLALYNYIEMRRSVNTPWFYVRKKVDTALNALFPEVWIPLYTTVAFSRMRYHSCTANRKWQSKVLARVAMGVGLLMLLVTLMVMWIFASSAENQESTHPWTPVNDTAPSAGLNMSSFCAQWRR